MRMITNKNQPPVMQTFLPFKDTVSMGHGDGSGFDLCGPQSYALEQLHSDSPPSFITLDEEARKITLETDENTETGSFPMYLVVTLTDYCDDDSNCRIVHKVSFEVVIDECSINNLVVDQPTTTSFNYDIQPSGAATLIIPYPADTIQPPECAFHGVVYDLEVNGSS